MKVSLLIHPSELSKNWIERMAAQGIDTLALHPEGGKDAAQSLAKLLELLENDSFRDLLDYAKECGLRLEYEIHAIGYLLDRALFAAHPEYFRMNEHGERTPDLNFCVSNPDALSLVAKQGADLIERLYRSEENYFFWMDDAKNCLCRCPHCRNLSASDQQLIFLNALLTEIRKKKKNAKLAYLAYHDTMALPKSVCPNDGIFLEYAPINKWLSENANVKENAEYVRRERQTCKLLLDYFGCSNSRVLEYWLDNSLFSGWKKPPKAFLCDREKIERDIREYKETGYENISVFACFLGQDYENLYGEPDITPFTETIKKYKTNWKR